MKKMSAELNVLSDPVKILNCKRSNALNLILISYYVRL